MQGTRRIFLVFKNLSQRIGQKNFPGKNKFREIWNLDCSIQVLGSEWTVRGAGLILLNIGHSHFQPSEELV